MRFIKHIKVVRVKSIMPTTLIQEQINAGCRVLAQGGIGCPRPQANTQPKIYSTQNGVIVSQGQTTLDKILNTAVTLATVVRGQPYIPTTQQPQQQPIYYPQVVENANTVATENTTGVGNQIESLIQNNKGLILVAGAAFLLLQMKPLSRR